MARISCGKFPANFRCGNGGRVRIESGAKQLTVSSSLLYHLLAHQGGVCGPAL